jgi:hypothetical protein
MPDSLRLQGERRLAAVLRSSLAADDAIRRAMSEVSDGVCCVVSRGLRPQAGPGFEEPIHAVPEFVVIAIVTN